MVIWMGETSVELPDDCTTYEKLLKFIDKLKTREQVVDAIIQWHLYKDGAVPDKWIIDVDIGLLALYRSKQIEVDGDTIGYTRHAMDKIQMIIQRGKVRKLATVEACPNCEGRGYVRVDGKKRKCCSCEGRGHLTVVEPLWKRPPSPIKLWCDEEDNNDDRSA